MDRRHQLDLFFATAITLFVQLGCQAVRHRSSAEQQSSSVPEPAVAPTSDTEACDENTSQGGNQISGPVLLFHGWGTKVLVKMTQMKKYLEDQGIASDAIYEPSYPYLLSYERIVERVIEQLIEIDEKYPSTTQYTVISHSLGQFVALAALLEGGWDNRIKKFISFGGFALGQEKRPDLCLGSVCGPIWDKLVPYENDFIKSFFNRHREVIGSWDKCSISARSDEKIFQPREAGDFEDGINIVVGEGLSHRDLIQDDSVFNRMLEKCYPNIARPICASQ